MDILNFLIDQVKHNQFLAAGVIGAPAAALMYTIRGIPKAIWGATHHQFMITVRFNSGQLVYSDALQYVTKYILIDKFVRSYIFSSTDQHEFNSGNTIITNRATELGYGTYLGLYHDQFAIVNRVLDESNKGDTFKEHFTITIVGRSKSIIETLMRDIEEYSDEKQSDPNHVTIKNNGYHGWVDLTNLPKRSINTIVSKDNVPQQIVDHIKKFEENKDWYHKKGMPHHTGILLYGPPGNAKSSIIHTVASELNRSILYLNLSDVKDAITLSGLLSNGINWKRSILVIEDIDAMNVSVNNRNDKKDDNTPFDGELSLSTILNTLDGLLCPDEFVVIATTNHIDRLDPAIVRPGRFDLSIKLNDLEKSEFENMCTLFDIDPSTYSLPYFEPISGATLRMLLLSNGTKAVEEYQINLKKG